MVGDLSNPLDQAKCKSVKLGATFTAPIIDAGQNWKLCISGGINASLGVVTESDDGLFGKNPYAPSIAIGKGQCWMSFGLDTLIEVGLNDIPVGGGFGVGIQASTVCQFCSYTLFESAAGPMPRGKDCIGQALSNFVAVNSAQHVRNQKPGTVHTCDISGTLKFTGSYSLPMSLNSSCLASVNTAKLKTSLPFNYNLSIQPDCDLKVSGSVAVSGDYIIRCHRVSDAQLQLGVYKKRQTTLAATFDASAGLEAWTGKKDLINSFFSAVAPKVDPKAAGLKEEDCELMEKALSASVDRSLSVCLNVVCSASFADEAAFVYSIDLTGNQADTDAALDSAFKGDWTKLQQLSNAKELRNVIGETKDGKHAMTVNLLGVYNYESIADFVGSCQVLHSPEDNGAITVTDRQTANRILVAAMPYCAAPDKLQKVLSEACVATMTYTAATSASNLNADIKVSQSLLIYQEKLDAKSVHKDLLTAVALRLIGQDDWQNLLPNNPNPLHVRIAAQAIFAGDAALQLFFSDPAARTPRKLEDVTRLGRSVFASLLDPGNQSDVKRRQNLNDDYAWSLMDGNRWTPELRQVSYPDWYDITFWAGAIADVAPALSAALAAADSVPAGQDPSKNADFMKKRARLADAIGQAVENSHAAYNPGWPIAVLCTLSDFKAKVSFQATWDGQVHVDKQSTPAVAAAAGATPTQP